MRSLLLCLFLICNVYLFGQDSVCNQFRKHDSIVVYVSQLDKIILANKENKSEFLEFLKLFAPAIAGGITALIALIGISKQIRNSQKLQRLDLVSKKKDKIIDIYSELISEINNTGIEGFKKISKQAPPSFLYSKKEIELKMQIAIHFENSSDYELLFNLLVLYKTTHLSNNDDVLKWLDAIENEFQKVISKIK